ncbi:dna-directed rna polymerases i ii and iii subunit rpabc2 [Holotrichia oblita]|uniref:Dna-directed rna polymerases i ii and iii subunit rpabc2 n=1 Tax=Holotrichia oblita TaxID=644536 RepID=A0ACB9SK41_HOLOL|nr:dna-directed rna polymerases i ii and iii subunit rpabc2 [Holotrichia oblita]
MSDYGSSDNEPLSVLVNKNKKRKICGRQSDVHKHFNNHSFETGPSCNCKRYRCFEVTTPEERVHIVSEFNKMSNRNEQNNYCCGLISVNGIQRRRPRQDERVANLRDNSYDFKVRIKDGTSVKEIQICQLAFRNMHGITNRILITLKKYISSEGHSLKDMRSKHKNRRHALSKEQCESMHEHIKSFKGRKAHYSLMKSDKIYLPEDLNVKRMWNMYHEKYSIRKVSYESYRRVNDFNIKFGYPRSDTCSFCDSSNVKKEFFKNELQKPISNEERLDLENRLKGLEAEIKLHKLQANTFYDRKRKAKRTYKKQTDFEAIRMDYSKNLPTPNITTNDVYYKRQLTFSQ